MRRRIMIYSCISITLIGVIAIMLVLKSNEDDVTSFTMKDYQYYIVNFPSEQWLGNVKDCKDAKKKAESLWVELYGESVKTRKPYIVSFDSINEVWLVMGSLPKNIDGGVPYVLLRKSDGKVLAVWHDK